MSEKMPPLMRCNPDCSCSVCGPRRIARLTTAVELLREARGWMVCGEPGSLSDRIDAFLRTIDEEKK